MTERNWNAEYPGSQPISAAVFEASLIVPVGLSKYRDGLYPLEPFTKEDAQNVLECDSQMAEKCCMLNMACILFIAVDEWYILAEQSAAGGRTVRWISAAGKWRRYAAAFGY